MSDEVFELRNGFKIYTVTLDTGEVLKYPAFNEEPSEDDEGASAGFWRKYKVVGSAFEKARTDGDRAQAVIDMHWILFDEALTTHEVQDWEDLSQKKMILGIAKGGEVSGTTQKK